MSRDPEKYLEGMSNSTVAAFLMASAAYLINFLKWYFCEPLCANPSLDIVAGVINWMGGPVDIGFYTFIASEGGRYMILAALEKRRMWRAWEAERKEWEAEREKWEAEREAEREKWEAEREAKLEAERIEREAELKKEWEARLEAAEAKIAKLGEELEKLGRAGARHDASATPCG